MQVGDEVPDVASSALKGAWEATQQLLRQRKISAGHDISDGGIVTALLEMSFSGNTGISVSRCIYTLTRLLSDWQGVCTCLTDSVMLEDLSTSCRIALSTSPC